ncbi:MAG: glycosyltransferase [Patescibacteria group bacterium]
MRMAKLAKYLSRAHWQPIVVTRTPGAPIRDHEAFKEATAGIKVYRIPTGITGKISSAIQKSAHKHDTALSQVAKYIVHQIRKLLISTLLFPDEFTVWNKRVFNEILAIAQTEKPDIVLSSGPPFSIHLLGLQLQMKTGIPLIADFRDGWLDNPIFDTNFLLHIRTKYAQRSIIKNARLVICATQHIQQQLLQRNPGEKQKIFLATNGFDPEDFPDAEKSYQKGTVLHIVYAGHIGTARYPAPFFRAFAHFLRETPEAHNTVFIDIYGTVCSQRNTIKKILPRNVVEHGYLPHREMIQTACKSDVLLVLFYKNEDPRAAFTGKLTECFAAVRPILALIDSGPVADIINQYQIGYVVDQNDENALRDVLHKLYGRWRSDDLHIQKHPDLIDRFNRKKIFEQLEKKLQAIV